MMPMADEDNWRSRGACASADPDLFFPISSSGASRHQEEQAKAVCARCGVRTECLDFAIVSRQAHGVWGGLGEAELAALRRSRRGAEGLPVAERIPGTGRVSRTARRRQPTEYERAAS